MSWRLTGVFWRCGLLLGGRKRDDVGSIVGWGHGAVDGCMGTGEREEVTMFDDRAGFGALNEDDVGVGDEMRWNKLVADGDFSLSCGDKGIAVLVRTARGDDGREKGFIVTAEDLLGVNGAAIVLISVGDELLRGGRHAMIGSPSSCRVLIRLEVSESEFLSWNSLTSSGA
jgi:hypothetical protein